jgi:hypothetical protein
MIILIISICLFENRYVFAIPGIMLLIIHFYYQTSLLMIVWESDSRQNNNNFYDFTNYYYSEMMKLFIKFYFLTLIFFVSLIKILLLEPFYLTCVFGFPLFPQILLNFGKRKARQPQCSFILILTLVHLSFPAYFLMNPHNFLSFRP